MHHVGLLRTQPASSLILFNSFAIAIFFHNQNDYVVQVVSTQCY